MQCGRMTRRCLLMSSAAAWVGSLCGMTPISTAEAADTDAEASVAGALAEWAGSKLGNQLGSMAIGQALGFLGLEPGQDVGSQLAAMNAKLDQILTDLDVLNAKVDQIAQSITQLTNNVDIGLKQAYAQITEATLVPIFGAIDTKFGSRVTASQSNLYGLLHLPSAGTSGVITAGTAFLQNRQFFWEKIHAIHYALTVQVGSSESLLQKWASLIVAKMHAKGRQAFLGGYASVHEAWFTQAIGYQLKAYAMVLFCAGTNSADLTTARQDMGSMIAQECAQYLDGLDRMALSLAQVALSGPTANPQKDVSWLPGTHEALLRGDVYARSLVTAFDGDAQTPQAKKLSGIYGRVVLRPSDLTADGQAPPRRAFVQYPPLANYWPSPQTAGLVTLGAASEFQSIDWTQSSSPFGALRAGASSGLRFGRYFWPTPAQPGPGQLTFEPLSYLFYHWTDRPLRQAPGSNVLQTNLRPQGRPGMPIYRPDAQVMLYSLSNLARIALKRGEPINFTFPLRNTYTVFGKTALFVIAFLDGWSSPANGPTFIANAPPGNETRLFPPNDVLSCPSLTNTAAAPHLLTFDTAPFRQAVENRAAPPGPSILADVKATLRCNWDSDPDSGGNEITRRTASTDYHMDLFTTGSSEAGTVQYYLRGQCKVLQGRRPLGMALTTTMQLALTCDKAGDVLLFSGSQNSDIVGPFNLQLMPNAKYRLSLNFIASAQFNYHANSGKLFRAFDPRGDIQDTLEFILTEIGFVRPAGTGYQAA